MYKIRKFINPIDGQQKFLNNIARRGYKLEKTGSLFYKFVLTSHPKHYLIQYVANKKESERREYSQVLKDMGYNVYSCPYNVVKKSLCSFKLRFIENGLAFKKMNNEILIVESDIEMNAENIDLYNNYDELLDYCVKERNALLYVDFMIILLIVFGDTSFSFMGKELQIENDALRLLFLSIELMLLIIVTILLISKQLMILQYKKESQIYE